MVVGVKAPVAIIFYKHFIDVIAINIDLLHHTRTVCLFQYLPLIIMVIQRCFIRPDASTDSSRTKKTVLSVKKTLRLIFPLIWEIRQQAKLTHIKIFEAELQCRRFRFNAIITVGRIDEQGVCQNRISVITALAPFF